MSGDSATDQFETLHGIVHIVTLTWKESVQPSQIVTYANLLRELSSRVEGVCWFSCGSDMGLRNGNADFAVVAFFENETAFRRYLEDPLHLEIIRDYASKMVITRTTAQLRV